MCEIDLEFVTLYDVGAAMRSGMHSFTAKSDCNLWSRVSSVRGMMHHSVVLLVLKGIGVLRNKFVKRDALPTENLLQVGAHDAELAVTLLPVKTDQPVRKFVRVFRSSVVFLEELRVLFR